MLTDLQIARYSRQIILPAVGGRGQQQLLSAAVAVAGQSEMARTAAVYLAAAGIGRLFLIGAQRTFCDDLETLNPDCRVTAVERQLTGAAANRIVMESGVVVCAGADPATVALLATQTLDWRRPFLYGRVTGTVGEITSLGGGRTGRPCYACLSRQIARDRAEGSDALCTPTATTAVHTALSGAIGALVGSIVAADVITLLLNLGSTLTSRRITYDALTGRMSATAIRPLPNCPVCGSPQQGGPSS